MSKKAQKAEKGTLKKVLAYLKPYRFLVLVSVLFSAVTVALTLYVPVLIGRAIDGIIGRGALPFLVGGTGLYVNAITEGYVLSDKKPDLELREKLEADFVSDVTGYGLYSDVTRLSGWEKFCMFAITWRSVMLIFGFLGLGLGLAVMSSGTAKSDLD